jgi:hypothetical protein
MTAASLPLLLMLYIAHGVVFLRLPLTLDALSLFFPLFGRTADRWL